MFEHFLADGLVQATAGLAQFFIVLAALMFAALAGYFLWWRSRNIEMPPAPGKLQQSVQRTLHDDRQQRRD